MMVIMYIKKYLTLIVSLIVVMGLGCATIQNALNIRKPSASLQGLKFEEITLDSATLLFDVEIDNPYPVALPLVNVDYDLASRAKSFLSGKADLQTTIAAHSKKSVLLPAKVTYLDLLQAFKGIRPGSVIPYSADVGLSVDAPALGLLRLPIKREGELLVPTVPEISEIDWKQVILDRATQ